MLHRSVRFLKPAFHWDRWRYFRLPVLAMTLPWGRCRMANLYRSLEAAHCWTCFNNFLHVYGGPSVCLWRFARLASHSGAPVLRWHRRCGCWGNSAVVCSVKTYGSIWNERIMENRFYGNWNAFASHEQCTVRQGEP